MRRGASRAARFERESTLKTGRMRLPPSIILLPTLVWWLASFAFGGGFLGERLSAFEAAFPERLVLRDAESIKESCQSFRKGGWMGVAGFHDGVCVFLLLLPAEEAGLSEEKIIAGLNELHPGLSWEKKEDRSTCADETCHGATFPGGRGAYLVSTEAQKQAKSRKSLAKDLFAQSMTAALLRLGDPVDYDGGVLTWETSQMRIGVPVCSSEMAYLAWEPTRQKKLRDKKVMRMTRDLIAADFNAPSYGVRNEGIGTLIGVSKGNLYCLLRTEASPFSYTVCKNPLRYEELEDMAERLVFPLPRVAPPVGREKRPPAGDATPPPAHRSLTDPSTEPKPVTAPEKTATPAVVPPALPVKHEDVLKSFIESLQNA